MRQNPNADYPDWMLSRYVGEFWDAFYYWWYDEKKNQTLEESMKSGKTLTIKPIDMKYWPTYLINNL